MAFKKFNRFSIMFFLILLLSFIIYNFYNNEPNKDFEKSIEEKKFEEKNKINIDLKWKELKDNLWINKNKKLGIKFNFFYNKDYSDYITEIGFFDPISLDKIIDTCSFVRLTNNHYKDSKNVYFVYQKSFRSEIKIFNKVDINSFVKINDYYSKDNKNIYYCSEVFKNVDYKSFSVNKYSSFGLAKDKYGLIAFGKRDKDEIEKILKYDIKFFESETKGFIKNSSIISNDVVRNIIKIEKSHPNNTIEIKQIEDNHIMYLIKDKNGNKKIKFLRY